MSRHRFRLQRPESVCVTHRHWWWHVEVDPCTASLPSPGRPQDGRGVRPAATRAPRPQRVSDPPQRCAGLMSWNRRASSADMRMDRLTAVVPGW